MSQGLWIAIAVIAVLIVSALVIGSLLYRRRQVSLRRGADAIEASTPVDRSGGYTASSGISFTQSSGPAPVAARVPKLDTTGLPGVGDDAVIPRDSLKRPIAQVHLPEPPVLDETPVPAGVIEEILPASPAAGDVGAIAPPVSDVGAIAPPAGRLERLRGRLAKSQNAFGRSMLGLLGGGDLDEASWEEVEDTLLIADLGPTATTAITAHLREKLASGNVRSEAEVRAVLCEVLIEQLNPEMDRSIKALPHAEKPSVLLVVGVNGTGKTTTVGKLARVLVADGRRVVLGAADTFRSTTPVCCPLSPLPPWSAKARFPRALR